MLKFEGIKHRIRQKRGEDLNEKTNLYIDNVRLSDDETAVIIIDQSKLPGKTVYLTLKSPAELWDAIYTLKVRGAPAIGIFAAYAMYVLSVNFLENDGIDFNIFYDNFKTNKNYLNSSRPTAVNLSKMLDRMESIVIAEKGKPLPAIVEQLKAEAKKIQHEDVEMCKAIAEYGLTLVKNGDGILTHCNAGQLATSKYGTGLGPFFLGAERGIKLKAWVDETRPLLQGARLTAFELQRAGIDCTLICDNMASIVMKEGKINACFVGCDRVAANGDTANKIGTSSAAILAKYYNIPFYVFCPSATIDFNCHSGGEIEIEKRPEAEIKKEFFASPTAPDDVKCYNPAFDITENELITAIITEKGICYPPYDISLKELFYKEQSK